MLFRAPPRWVPCSTSCQVRGLINFVNKNDPAMLHDYQFDWGPMAHQFFVAEFAPADEIVALTSALAIRADITYYAALIGFWPTAGGQFFQSGHSASALIACFQCDANVSNGR